MKFLFSILILFLLTAPFSVQADSAFLYFSPSSGSFSVGNTFNISIFINTGGENVNAIEANIEFDPRKLQVTAPTGGMSFIEIWAAQPTYSNTEGTIKFAGGIPSPGINTTAGLISTVTFRAMAPGETTVFFSENSKVLRNDPMGTNILGSAGRGTYTLMVPPPEGPTIFSPTHPDTGKWYKDNNPTFCWEKEEGTDGFSYILDQDPWKAPDNISEGAHSCVSYSEIPDGIWYFHIKAVKEGVWGGISRYLVQIDTTPPAAFSPTVAPAPRTIERRPLISFITTDALSGISHYELKYVDITPERKSEDIFFSREVTSPYHLSHLEIGKYLIVVRAYDNAGNWQEGTTEVQIIPDKIIFTKEGVQFRVLSLPWWGLFLALTAIISSAALYFWKGCRFLAKKKKRLNGIEMGLKNRQEEIINKISRP